MRGATAILVGVIVLAAACGRRSESPPSDPLQGLRERLPVEVEGWRADPTADGIWDTESIYGYIDGHAEVYLAYGMTGCLSRTYRGPEGEGDVVVDLFRLASSADAWGVFRHDADGEPVEVGQAARLRPGWLTAWQGPFAVSVTADGAAVPAEVLVSLGRSAVEAIGVSGAPPRIVGDLPADGLLTESVRFVRHPLLLNSHLFLSNDDLLGLAGDAEVALGRYRRGDRSSWLVMVDYPGEERAEAGERSVLAGYLPEAREAEPVATEDGTWSAVGRRGRRLALVVGAETPELARALLGDVIGGGGR